MRVPNNSKFAYQKGQIELYFKFKAKNKFQSLARWAILKTFEEYPDEVFSLHDLLEELKKAWEDLKEEGTIYELDK